MSFACPYALDTEFTFKSRSFKKSILVRVCRCPTPTTSVSSRPTPATGTGRAAEFSGANSGNSASFGFHSGSPESSCVQLDKNRPTRKILGRKGFDASQQRKNEESRRPDLSRRWRIMFAPDGLGQPCFLVLALMSASPFNRKCYRMAPIIGNKDEKHPASTRQTNGICRVLETHQQAVAAFVIRPHTTKIWTRRLFWPVRAQIGAHLSA